jgi:hypothetical protein
MVQNKSVDPYYQIIVRLLCDVQTTHSEVFTPRAQRLTTQKVEKRLAREGLGFLTKTLPRLGKALDRALTGEQCLDAATLAFDSKNGSKLPRFLGELFERVFSHDGWILPTPCVKSIKVLRDILFVFYKLELPYETDQEQAVINRFIKTEDELSDCHNRFCVYADAIDANPYSRPELIPGPEYRIIYHARRLLAEVFRHFDHLDIHPRHGPGAVATRESLWSKYLWTNVSDRITQTYPLDAYFYASLGHVCDAMDEIKSLPSLDRPARVLLVPKDSRGPRLISCEPVDFQWIQQGLGRAIVSHVETCPLTRHNVHFTDQRPNQLGALLGSSLLGTDGKPHGLPSGRYATLDLNEASDRVTVGLVRLLFPEPILSALLNCRSQSTVLPGGRELKLNKFAPMGSALCFPILALAVWSLLSAGAPDADARESILVYGDDVVVPTAQAVNAITLLESFGLKVNRDKSCVSGFFRESCGEDAFRGETVTPVRLRTVWTSSRCPESYTSYIAFANHLYSKSYHHCYEYIVELLHRTYGELPDVSMNLSCPSLMTVPEAYRPKRRRTNKDLQKSEWLVYDVGSCKVNREIGGWSMLLRFFAEATTDSPLDFANSLNCEPRRCGVKDVHAFSKGESPLSVRTYTYRKRSYLRKRWR